MNRTMTRDPARVAVTAPPPWQQRGARLLRVLSVLALFDTLVQAALAGLFITGDVGLLDWHGVNASVLALLVALEAGAAFLVWRPGRGPAGPFLLALGLLVLVGVQQALGAARVIAGHVPLGMAIFGLGAALTYWSFSSAPRGDTA
jgi:heme A synthase